MIRKAAAALLSLLLVSGEVARAATPIARPEAPRSIPSAPAPLSARMAEPAVFPAAPSIAGVPAALPTPIPATPAAIPNPGRVPETPLESLAGLSADAKPEPGARLRFDGARPESAPALPGESAPPSTPRPSQLARTEKVRFKTAVAAGAAAAIAAPVVLQAAPALMMVYTAAAAAAGAGALWAINAVARRAARRTTGPAKNRPRRAKAAMTGFGLLLGVVLGITPLLFSRDIIETGARLVVPSREVRAVDPDFGREVVAVLSKNSEGRKLLDGLRDRFGVLRPPKFFIARLNNADGFSFPVLNGVFLDPAVITSRGWTVKEFLATPEKRGQLAREADELLFHELFHALQFRKVIQPGQLERFPRQLHRYLTVELEYEANIADRLYVHEKLRADPLAAVYDLSNYSLFLDDLDAYLESRVDDSSATYALFAHTESRYYRQVLADQRARMPALSVEGYSLLARRFRSSDPELARQYLEKARRRALESGLAKTRS